MFVTPTFVTSDVWRLDHAERVEAQLDSHSRERRDPSGLRGALARLRRRRPVRAPLGQSRL